LRYRGIGTLEVLLILAMIALIIILSMRYFVGDTDTLNKKPPTEQAQTSDEEN
jgi:hypothetical protein